MNTNTAGFRWFQKILHLCALDKVTSALEGLMVPYQKDEIFAEHILLFSEGVLEFFEQLPFVAML